MKHWIYSEPGFEDKIVDHEKQRVERGFSKWDWWNFNTHLTEMIIDGLKMFRHEGMSHPANLTLEQWNADLDFMIEWFIKYKQDDIYILGDTEKSKENAENWSKAKEMFARHFDDLWD